MSKEVKLPKKYKKLKYSKLEKLLEQGLDPNSKKVGYLFCHYVAHGDKKRYLKLLLKHGVSVDSEDEDGNSALEVAINNQVKNSIIMFLLDNGATVTNDSLVNASFGNSVVLKRLLEYDVDINHVDYNGNTPLLAAIQDSKTNNIKLLIEHGANPNLESSGKIRKTPLMQAMVEDPKRINIDIIDYLVANGADVNLENSKGITPLKYAMKIDNNKYVDILIGLGADISNFHPVDAEKLFFRSIYRKWNNIFKLLLRRGMDLSIVNKIKYTPLIMTIVSRNTEAFWMLINSGLNLYINYRKSDGVSALKLSVNLNLYDITEALLNKGADINILGSKDQSILTQPIIHNHEDMVKLLLLRGADPNGMGINRENEGKEFLEPLIFKCTNRPRMTKLMLNYGADPNSRSELGYSVLEHATLHTLRFYTAGKLLLEFGAKVDFSLEHARENDVKIIMDYLTDLKYYCNNALIENEFSVDGLPRSFYRF